MSNREPLLVPRPSSEHSSVENDEEVDALLTGRRTNQNRKFYRRAGFWREAGLFAWGLIATAAVIVLAVVFQHQRQTPGKSPSSGEWEKPSGKRNLIFMVSDGMGPTSMSLTRTFRQFTNDLPVDDVLVLDKHHIGQSRTRSSSSLVTDSAAGATAFSCGMKSYNGAISVTPEGSPCGTVLEAAKAAGYMTGLVVTTRLTDATPACFASHARMRSYEDLIAEHEIGEYPLGRQVDLMLGGGRCHFLPKGADGSCRGDEKDIVKKAKSKGFSYVNDRAGFDGLKQGNAAKLPLLGLFAGHDIPYEIDRRFLDDEYPSLEEMTRTALKALSDATKDSDQGFFIMIEGSRIDHAGHGNDPAAQVHEVLAYDKAFSAVLEFLENDSTPGVLVSTSDHETGGVAAARQLHPAYPSYKWYPGVLANATHSSEHLQSQLNAYLDKHEGSTPEPDIQAHVRTKFVEEGLGILDATDDEIDKLVNAEGDVPASYVLADMISRRAEVGWSTHGHSGADVNIYASSPKGAAPLIGNHENMEVGGFIADYLSLDLEHITSKLKDLHTSPKNTDAGFDANSQYPWMGEPLGDDVVVDELDTYHGDFKRLLRKSKRSNTKRSNEASSCGCGGVH